MAGLPYVGSKISLISQSEIRYEGTLHEIDKEQQTVSLVNVRSFGTEGRRSDLFIKPKPTPFKLIVFRGQDIKDLNVQQPVPEGDSDFKDPAILAHEEAAAPAAGAAQPKSKSSAKKAAAANRKKIRSLDIADGAVGPYGAAVAGNGIAAVQTATAISEGLAFQHLVRDPQRLDCRGKGKQGKISHEQKADLDGPRGKRLSAVIPFASAGGRREFPPWGNLCFVQSSAHRYPAFTIFIGSNRS